MSTPIPFFKRALALLAWLLAGQALAQAGNAVVTITEGPAQILRGVNRSPAATGVKVAIIVGATQIDIENWTPFRSRPPGCSTCTRA